MTYLTSLGNWEKGSNNVTLNETKDTFILKQGHGWNFDLKFGKYNVLYYTGWTSNRFRLEFTKK